MTNAISAVRTNDSEKWSVVREEAIGIARMSIFVFPISLIRCI